MFPFDDVIMSIAVVLGIPDKTFIFGRTMDYEFVYVL